MALTQGASSFDRPDGGAKMPKHRLIDGELKNQSGKPPAGETRYEAASWGFTSFCESTTNYLGSLALNPTAQTAPLRFT